MQGLLEPARQLFFLCASSCQDRRLVVNLFTGIINDEITRLKALHNKKVCVV
jgi:hypothetical protein